MDRMKGEIELDEKPIQVSETVLNKAGFDYTKCKTWTTDGFYRETKEMVLYRKEEGYSVTDSLANINEHGIRNWGNDTFAVALQLAMDAVVEV